MAREDMVPEHLSLFPGHSPQRPRYHIIKNPKPKTPKSRALLIRLINDETYYSLGLASFFFHPLFSTDTAARDSHSFYFLFFSFFIPQQQQLSHGPGQFL